MYWKPGHKIPLAQWRGGACSRAAWQRRPAHTPGREEDPAHAVARWSLLVHGATEATRSRAAWPRRLGGRGGALLTRDGEELFSHMGEAASSRAAEAACLRHGGGGLLARDSEELFSRAAKAACSLRGRCELGEEPFSRRGGGGMLAARVQRGRGGSASPARWTTSPARSRTSPVVASPAHSRPSLPMKRVY